MSSSFLEQLAEQCDAYWKVCPGRENAGMEVRFGVKHERKTAPPTKSLCGLGELAGLAAHIGEDALALVKRDCTHSKCGVLLGLSSGDGSAETLEEPPSAEAEPNVQVTFCLGAERHTRIYHTKGSNSS